MALYVGIEVVFGRRLRLSLRLRLKLAWLCLCYLPLGHEDIYLI
jgi:hypothetical protein